MRRSRWLASSRCWLQRYEPRYTVTLRLASELFEQPSTQKYTTMQTDDKAFAFLLLSLFR